MIIPRIQWLFREGFQTPMDRVQNVPVTHPARALPSMPMEVRKGVAHDKVLDNTSRAALERGPVLYCVEGIDNAKLQTPHDLLITDEAEFKAALRFDSLGRVSVLTSSTGKATPTVPIRGDGKPPLSCVKSPNELPPARQCL
jgi:hypothetical protein